MGIIGGIKKRIEEKQLQLDGEKQKLEQQLSELQTGPDEAFNILNPVKSIKGKINRNKEIDELKRKISDIENQKKNINSMPLLAGVFAFFILVVVFFSIRLGTHNDSSSSKEESAITENAIADSGNENVTESAIEPTTEETEQSESFTEPMQKVESVKETKEQNVTSDTKSDPVSYSTNDKDTVKNGASGIYSYKSRGGTYENYYLIDLDEGYVYFFSEGNGETGADRVKIDSGTLNDVVVITYHDTDGSTWSYGLHFKYKNQPDHLILQDNDGFEYDYYTTNLKDAQHILNSKDIHDY